MPGRLFRHRRQIRRTGRSGAQGWYFGTSYLRLDPLGFGDYTRDEVAQSYGQSARYVLHFLNGALKGDRGGFDYLMKKPEQLGLPRHSVGSQFFAARP